MFYPEETLSLPSDDAPRSARKWNELLYEQLGDKGPTAFPEGSKPLPSDSKQRTLQKVDALLS
jgi:hypothetical protein